MPWAIMESFIWLIDECRRFEIPEIVKTVAWHIVTSEYPPQTGGVSDYTQLIARALADTGDEVHVWCPAAEESTRDKTNAAPENAHDSPVIVHREFGHFAPADLRRVDKLLDEFPAPRRLFVQWVPHGYGYRSMNLPFCFWLRRRAVKHHDVVELMVHEPYLAFGEGSWRQNGVAAVHRLMTLILLRSVRRVWISIPSWESRWRPYALGRRIEFRWLPVAGSIPVVDDPVAVQAIRTRYTGGNGILLGHFGAYDRNIMNLLMGSVPALLQNGAPQSVLLLGQGSEVMRDELVKKYPQLAGRLQATGRLEARELSLHLSACHAMLQPYVDGISGRRTSTMAALAHGLPVVTTSGRLTEPLWAETAAVAMVPVQDVSALIEMTQSLLKDVETRKRMSAAARLLYSEYFNVHRIIASLREPRR